MTDYYIVGFSCFRLSMPHYRSVPSIRQPVCPLRDPNAETKKLRKSLNVPRGSSNGCADLQLKKVKGQGHRTSKTPRK